MHHFPLHFPPSKSSQVPSPIQFLVPVETALTSFTISPADCNAVCVPLLLHCNFLRWHHRWLPKQQASRKSFWVNIMEVLASCHLHLLSLRSPILNWVLYHKVLVTETVSITHHTRLKQTLLEHADFKILFFQHLNNHLYWGFIGLKEYNGVTFWKLLSCLLQQRIFLSHL